MRRAFTLIEVLVVVTIAPLLMVAIGRVYVTFIRDIPRMTRSLQVNTTVLDALRQMRRDIDGAVGLPEQFEGRYADERTLLVEQPGGVVCYQLEDGRIVRTPFGVPPVGAGPRACPGEGDHGGAPLRGKDRSDPRERGTPNSTGPQSEEQRVWRVPEAVIAWRPWVRDGRAYAVEVHSHVKQRVEGVVQKKLANAQVFFLQGSAKQGEIQ